MTKKNILVFVDYFLPGYKAGGPIKSVATIIKALNPYFNFTVVTQNHDLNDKNTYTEVANNEWIERYGCKIIYLNKKNTNADVFKGIIQDTDFDVVYFNSLFAPMHTLAPLRLVRKYKKDAQIVLAPRGMLGENSLKIKPLKKKIFLRLTKLTRFFEGITWHASSQIEANEIRLHYGKTANIKIASNITLAEDIDLTLKIEKQPNKANFFFLSRIQSIKNLHGALQALKQFNHTNTQIQYDIIGPIEDQKYWQMCQTIIEELDKNCITVRYLGGIPNHQLKEKLTQYHFLLMPTLNENYGHAIVESFANGCPVIISNQTQWLDLTRQQIGWDTDPNDTTAFEKSIQEAVQMNQETYQTWAKNCLQFVNQTICSQDILQKNIELFQ